MFKLIRWCWGGIVNSFFRYSYNGNPRILISRKRKRNEWGNGYIFVCFENYEILYIYFRVTFHFFHFVGTLWKYVPFLFLQNCMQKFLWVFSHFLESESRQWKSNPATPPLIQSQEGLYSNSDCMTFRVWPSPSFRSPPNPTDIMSPKHATKFQRKLISRSMFN